jgi:Protein of unknown function (DUF4238)
MIIEILVARPKQHHYVTRAYLEGFVLPSEQHLVCYGRDRGPFRKIPQDLACQRNYYAIRKENGTWDDSLEQLMASTVEEPGLSVIQKLVTGKTRLTWDERDAITLLLAIQEMRTPSARERARVTSKIFNERIIGEIKAANPDQTSVDIAVKSGRKSVTLDEMLEAHEILCDDHAKEIHRILFDAAFKIRDFYRHMKFTVFYAMGKHDFVTTDTPVIRVFYSSEPLGTGMNRRDIEVRFPLSRRAFLTLTHDLPFVETLMRLSENKRSRLLDRIPEVRVQQATDAQVMFFNKGHARHALRWLFSADNVDWAADILSQVSAAPTIIDLSTRDLIHCQSAVNYNPKLDS